MPDSTTPAPSAPESKSSQPIRAASASPADESRPDSFDWRDWLALFVVGSVAAAYRLIDLGNLPPGLHHDEAVNGLDILFTIPAQHPIFFEANNGREPLFIYAQSLIVSLLGSTAYSLRLTSALFGIATVLATWLLARQWLGRTGALIAGLGLATAFWHVDLSRVGLRAISAPLFIVLALYFTWQMFATTSRRRRWLSAGLAGLLLGLGLYTYLSARVFPLIVIAAALWEVLHAGRAALRRWPAVGLALMLTIAVAAPLGLYFVDHLDLLVDRSQQVSIFNPNPVIEGKPDTFQHNLVRNLGMFFIAGDDNPRHNLPGRPVFDPLAAPFFVLGLGLTLWRSLDTIRRRTRAPDWSAWLLAWLAGVWLLGILTYESPNFLRLTALAPAVYLTWAIGLMTAGRWLARRVPGSAGRFVPPLLVGLLLTYEAASTGVDYFRTWATSAEVYRAFDASVSAAARRIATVPAAEPLFIYIDRSPILQYLTPRSRQAEWLQEYTSLLPLPASAEAGAFYLFNGQGDSGAPALYFADHPSITSVADPARRTDYTAYDLTPADVTALGTPKVSLSQHLGPVSAGVDLLGYSLDEPGAPVGKSITAQPGQKVGLTLYWRESKGGDPEKIYAPYVHFVDARGRAWGQDDKLGFKIGGWRAGERFLSRHEWTVPADVPPVTLQVEIGMAVRPFGMPPGAPAALGSPVAIANITIDRSGPVSIAPAPTASHTIDADLGAGIRLAGFDLPAGPLKPGDTIGVDLLWQASQGPGRDLTAEISLIDSGGQPVAAQAARPVAGQYPTTAWRAGEWVRDPREIAVPGQTGSGRLRVRLRLLDATTSQPVTSGDPLTLGEIEVIAPKRDFALPPVQHPLSTEFGGEIALRGYDLDRTSLTRDGTLKLKLYWQATAAPTKSYTVFTHLLDSANVVVAQQDSQPVHGTVPTLGWVLGQVVVDDYTLTLNGKPITGETALEVGLYDANSGQRLKLASGEDHLILTRLPIGQ